MYFPKATEHSPDVGSIATPLTGQSRWWARRGRRPGHEDDAALKPLADGDGAACRDALFVFFHPTAESDEAGDSLRRGVAQLRYC